MQLRENPSTLVHCSVKVREERRERSVIVGAGLVRGFVDYVTEGKEEEERGQEREEETL